MILVVGLGNPGAEYTKTRHNFGFIAIDTLAERFGLVLSESRKWAANVAEGAAAAQQAAFLQPLTFMNHSGQVVGKYASYYKIEPKDIWVISDDLDLPIGTIRIRTGSSSGGHNGLKSIDEALGTEHYGHIRLGIGSEETQFDKPSADFVLENFTKEEWPIVTSVANLVAKVVGDGLTNGHLPSETYKAN